MRARHGATLETLRTEGFRIREIYPWSVAMTDLAEAAEVVGDSDVARHVISAAGPYSGRIAVSGPCINRPFDQALARAALTLHETEAALSYATSAVGEPTTADPCVSGPRAGLPGRGETPER